MRRIAITGMGCVSGLGQGVAESWRRALAGQGGIRDHALPDHAEEPDARIRASGPAAPVDGLDTGALEAQFGTRVLGHLDPLALFALVAAMEAVEQAGLIDDPVLDRRTGVILGCGSGGNATFDAAYRRLYERGLPRSHPQTIPTAMASAPASHLAMRLGIHGPAMMISSACASSAHALGEAAYMIRAGRVDVAIAGGTEACLTPGSWLAWQALGATAPDTCRPFSADRKGLVLGEGAAVLILEDRERAEARGATIHGELAGYGASSDAAHITAPDRDGILAAIRAAHDDAALDPHTPALISAHGTGTRLNDATEASALRAFYGGALAEHVVIATKSAHGHLIGGSGALEFLLGLVALRERIAPPILHHRAVDPDCDLPLALTPTTLATEWLVSNSFAFGGLNAVLIGRRG